MVGLDRPVPGDQGGVTAFVVLMVPYKTVDFFRENKALNRVLERVSVTDKRICSRLQSNDAGEGRGAGRISTGVWLEPLARIGGVSPQQRVLLAVDNVRQAAGSSAVSTMPTNPFNVPQMRRFLFSKGRDIPGAAEAYQ